MGTGILMITSEVNNPASILYYHDGSYQILRQQENVFCDAAIEEFTYPGHNGEAFTGYLFYPEKKPLNGIVLDIHGGPHYCYGLGYSIDVHLMTEAGYAVVYSNPAGSQGNGEMIARASYHDWGGKDYQDLTSCVQRVMQLPRFSGLKLAVKGGSYGGYMVNWMIGHTDIFTCAISERSTCNRYSQAGTSDCAFRYGKFEFEDFPWEHCDSYMEHSPITYVKNVKTPVLLIHGDYDMNCPISQSEEWYSALKLENKEVYFARFKGQNHGFAVKGDPVCRKERYQLLLWWLNRYMKKYVYLQEYIHPKARALLEDKVNIIDNIDEIGKADAIISRNQFKVTKEVLDKAENLKVIGVHGTGMDNIDAEAARQKGVEIFNTPGINARSVAELNVLLALSLLRKTSQAADDIKAGKDMSNAKQDYQGNELTGKKVGFIGYGNIARHTADILKNGFSAKVYAWSRSLTPTKAEEENVIYCSGAEEVMSCADIIFLGLKLTEENQYIIHIDNLKKCKPSAILINTARGKLVKEEDLYRALTQHIIAGAASDVFEKEPVSSENILVPLSNFIPTPHLGANTEEALYRVGMAVVTGVLDRLSVTVTEEEMERYQL
jgi:D-3-phosphoglycerate dehydrogenase